MWICNIAKTEHRYTDLSFENTPEIQNIREQFVLDFFMVVLVVYHCER